jgi:hypothetical protein
VIGAPSRLRLIRKAADFTRISPHFDFTIEENAARRKWKYDDPKLIALTELLKLQKSGQFPDEPVRIEV